MDSLIKNIRPSDIVLAVVMTALGALLMIMDMTADPAPAAGAAHGIDSQSWLLVPVFFLATVPILFRRTNVNAVIAVTIAAMAVHVVSFGWLIRCGAGLPLAFALAYSVGRFATDRNQQVLGLILATGLQAAVLVQDSAAGIGILPATVVIGAVCQGIGMLVTRQIAKRDAGAPRRSEQFSTL